MTCRPKKRGAYSLAEWETIKQAIECFALRITYACRHVTNWLFARYNENARTLIFGCNECIPPVKAILVVDVKSKNWIRTKKHHDLPRRKTGLQDIQIGARVLPPRSRSEFVFTKLEKLLRQSTGNVREVSFPARTLKLRPAHETAFESMKMLRDKFPQHFSEPFNPFGDIFEARAAEADAHFIVRFAS